MIYDTIVRLLSNMLYTFVTKNLVHDRGAENTYSTWDTFYNCAIVIKNLVHDWGAECGEWDGRGRQDGQPEDESSYYR